MTTTGIEGETTSEQPPPRVIAGVAVAALYVLVALVCLFATTSADDLFSRSAGQTRNISVIPYVVLALALLVVGLVTRRWWQAVIAPVVVAAGGFWWETWLIDLPQRMADNGWSAERADEATELVGTTWRVVAAIVVVVGWGLVRRRGSWWAVAVLPAAVLVGIGEVVKRLVDPGPYFASGGGSREEFFAEVSRTLRTYGATDIAITTIAVVGGIWLCVLAEKHLPAGRRTE